MDGPARTRRSSPQARRDADVGAVTVLGVFLGIVIAILFGGAVWVMIDKIRQSHPVNTNSLHVTFTVDHSTSPARVKVTKAPAGSVDWVSDLTLSGSCKGAGHLTLNGGPFPTAAGTTVNPGDVLAGCASGETLAITSSPAHGSELLLSTTF